MATFRAYDTFVDSGNTTSIVANKPTGTAEGDLLFIFISSDVDTTTITPPAGWSTLYDEIDAGSQTSSVYYKVAGASEPSSYTITKSSERAGGLIWAVEDPGPIDVHDSNTGGATSSAICPTVTPSVDDTLLFRLVACDGAENTDPHTQVSGYTLLDTVSVFSGGCASVQYKDWTSGATGTESIGLSSSDEWTGFTIAVAPAGVNISGVTAVMEYTPQQATVVTPDNPIINAATAVMEYTPQQAVVEVDLVIFANTAVMEYTPQQADIDVPQLSATPSNLVATAISETRIELEWDL